MTETVACSRCNRSTEWDASGDALCVSCWDVNVDHGTPHGTYSTCQSGCRCGECRAAQAAYQREYYAANKERIAAQRREAVASGRVPHGTSFAYTYGCRCDECRAVHAARCREYYATNKERIAAYNREYYAANKERIAAQRREYRARKRGAA